MAVHSHAGKAVRAQDRVNIAKLVSEYYTLRPDIENIEQRVTFGTSGHRGNASLCSFNEMHILAICQAVAEYRRSQGFEGPLYLGKDTHALSEPAFASALSVLVANDIPVVIQDDLGFTPTPVISRLIIVHNRNATTQADGLIITPSHNPPSDGGIKYNPPHGGPAEGEVTKIIEARANEIIASNLQDVRQVRFSDAMDSDLVTKQNFIEFYTQQLEQVLNLQAISEAGIKIGVDPLGGSGINYWPQIAKRYQLDLTMVNDTVDASFSFMPLDKDGKIRMDCSSPYAMSGLIAMKDDFDVAVGNDPDFDRHGIVTKSGGLMNPNHFLAVAIHYLMTHRHWSTDCKIGKTLVSSSLIDRVARLIERPLSEVPVGFKWFVEGLASGEYAFGGEESAGASFLAKDGTCWTTDKDGFIMALLAAEILAVTGKDPYQYYLTLAEQLGKPCYGRVEAPANLKQKQVLTSLTPDMVATETLAGEPILQVLSHAPGNDAAIGGLKVVSENGWFAARPSGTEDIYKIYAESFNDEDHLAAIIAEAQQIISKVFEQAN
ncbi:phosphoglucomutase (alpha-D-glucose-1,6-bisphosphate-dependent) [Thalassotalea ganghwensis]